MQRTFILVVALLLSVKLMHAATGDTTVIVTHNGTNLNSPPSNDDIWVVFPNTSTGYHKVIMKFVLGCGTPNCSGWDYTVNTQLGKKNGVLDSTVLSIDTLTNDTAWNVFEKVEFIEVGRLITPYGTYMANGTNGFNNSWTHPYYYDLTDYAEWLKDSVNVRVHYDGWTDAFSAKIEFLFIEGPPSREVESVREIYHTYLPYPNLAGFESAATPQTFSIASNVSSAKVAIIMTGHGSQGEFEPHQFQLKVNNILARQNWLWKNDCGLAAIAPQGGTWIFNRANWCPGEKVNVIEVDITPYITPGQNVSIDLDFDDFVVAQGQSAGYITSAHLITYLNEHSNDVMLDEIIAPSNDKNYGRFNPSCTNPIVRIKNMGKNPLTYAEISYGVPGGSKWYYEWTGNLPPFQTEVVTLPAFDWNGLDTNNRRFYAEVAWPNQQPDANALNNRLESSFDMTPQMEEVFVLFFRANNQPQENAYVLRNENGDTIYARSTFTAGANHLDTFYLSWGSYTLDFYDYDNQWEGGDGISWWLNTQQGWETSGQLALRRLNNQTIRNFNPDFGSRVHYEFTVGYPLGYNEPKQAPEPPVHPSSVQDLNAPVSVSVFPNPARDWVSVQLQSPQTVKGTVTILDLQGRNLYAKGFHCKGEVQLQLPTSRLAAGNYIVRVQSGKWQKSVQIQVQ